MKPYQFLLESDECELLLVFEDQQTIEKTALAIGRDASGVSRQLATIARKFPAVEKRNGRWVLTEIGKHLNSCSRGTIQVQKHLARVQSVLRIGTNREFAARLIGPAFMHFSQAFPESQLVLLSFEHGTEEALLGGRIDIAFDCERPRDPDIAYKMLVSEPIVAVCSSEFFQLHKEKIRTGRWYELPHLLCERLHPDKIYAELENQLQIRAMFNDVAAARAACIVGAGWSLLPKYAVRDELVRGELVVMNEGKLGESRYGVWWSRSRNLNPLVIQKAAEWLKAQSL